jgi:hypothetical protein
MVAVKSWLHFTTKCGCTKVVAWYSRPPFTYSVALPATVTVSEAVEEDLASTLPNVRVFVQRGVIRVSPGDAEYMYRYEEV